MAPRMIGSRTPGGVALLLVPLLLLLLLPCQVSSVISLKTLFRLYQLGSSPALSSKLQGRFRGREVSDSLHNQCMDFDRWRDPLAGSRPAPEGITPPPVASLPTLGPDHVDRERRHIIRIAADTKDSLKEMLEVFQEHGFIRDPLESHKSSVHFIPYMDYRPWSLEDRPRDLYRILSTYIRILHYYACVMAGDNRMREREIFRALNRRDRPSVLGAVGTDEIDFYEPIGNSRGSSSSNGRSSTRRTGDSRSMRTAEPGWAPREETERHLRESVALIVNVESYYVVREDLILILGHVYITLHDVNSDVVTLDYEVTKAADLLRNAGNLFREFELRALLCLELYRFLETLIVELTEEQPSVSELLDEVIGELQRLEKPGKVSSKTKLENDLLKESSMNTPPGGRWERAPWSYVTRRGW